MQSISDALYEMRPKPIALEHIENLQNKNESVLVTKKKTKQFLSD